MAENLKTTKYNDCTDLPLVSDNTRRVELSATVYWWYNNDSTTDKTTFTFQLGKESKVRLEIFNMEGDLIKVLVDRKMAGGRHQIEWDNRSGEGTCASSGVYFYRLKFDNFMQTKQLVIH